MLSVLDMGQGRISRIVGIALFLSAVVSMFGFWSRATGGAHWLFWARSLKWTLYLMVGCAAYMAAVGIYHTVLAALGLDGQPGLFSRGARTGPFSGIPVERPARTNGASETQRRDH